MAGLHIALLGGLEIAGDETTARTLPTKKTCALVAYLALRRDRGQSREKLAELLWSNCAEKQARANLRNALSSIRKALNGDDAGYLVTEGDQVALAGPDIELDVTLFERLVSEATPDALTRAAALYKGDLLDGFSLREDSFEAWARVERERLRHLSLGRTDQTDCPLRRGWRYRALHRDGDPPAEPGPAVRVGAPNVDARLCRPGTPDFGSNPHCPDKLVI